MGCAPGVLQHHHRMVQIRQHGLADGHQFALARHRLHVAARPAASGTARPENCGRCGSARPSVRPRTRWESRAAFARPAPARPTAARRRPAIPVARWCAPASISNSPLASAAQFLQVRAAAQRLAQIVRDGAHVGAARAVRPQARRRRRPAPAASARRRAPAPAPAPPPRTSAPVRRRACPSTFLAETGGGVCRNSPRNRSSAPFELRRRRAATSRLLAGRLAGAVVGVGGPAEAHHALVDLVAARVELRQARGAPDHQRQHAGGDGVERSQVPDLLGPGDAAHLVHHVVRGPPFRFIDYDDSVQLGFLCRLALRRASRCIRA